MSTRLFVGGLPWAADDQDLRTAFEEFGEVVDVAVIKDRETGRSKGFGFVTFATAEDAHKAVAGMDGRDMGGRPIRVNEAQERAQRPRGPGGPRGPVIVDRRGGPARGGGFGGPPSGFGGGRPSGPPPSFGGGGFSAPPPMPGALPEEGEEPVREGKKARDRQRKPKRGEAKGWGDAAAVDDSSSRKGKGKGRGKGRGGNSWSDFDEGW
jgi:cold-inducible RNA-binding protein